MGNMNCPFCHKQLVKDGDGYYTCYTDNCAVMSAGGNGASGSASVWLKLIQMHDALEVATSGLVSIVASGFIHETLQETAGKTLDKIYTITKQKERFADTSKTIEQKEAK